MYCTKCGQKQSAGDSFCTNCGNKNFSVTSPDQIQKVGTTVTEIPALPANLQSWNWGAAGLTWIWGLGNGVWLALLQFIPIVSWFWWIVLGINGSKWAWQAGGYKKGEVAFRAQQESWKVAGIIFFFIVPVALIGILSSIGLVSLNGAREKVRDAARKSDISLLRTALALYYDDQQNPSYYTASTPLEVDSQDSSSDFSTALISKGYVTALPKSPVVERQGSDYHYWYLTTTTGDHFALYSKLESTSNYYVATDNGDPKEQSQKPVCDTTCH